MLIYKFLKTFLTDPKKIDEKNLMRNEQIEMEIIHLNRFVKSVVSYLIKVYQSIVGIYCI